MWERNLPARAGCGRRPRHGGPSTCIMRTAARATLGGSLIQLDRVPNSAFVSMHSMHELSIAMELIDVASEELARLGGVHVTAVRLRVGPLSGVVKDALLFSFDAAVIG